MPLISLSAPAPSPSPATDTAVQDALADRGDWISSYWVAGAALALGVLLVVLAVRAMRRRRARRMQAAAAGTRAPRGPRSWPYWVAAVVALLLGLGIGVNAWVGYIDNVDGLWRQLGYTSGSAVVDPTGTATHEADATVATISTPLPTGKGASGTVTITAPAALDMPTPQAPTWVYTPPGYDPSGKILYPVIYLHHGSPGDSADWFSSGLPAVMDALITTGKLRPSIAVAADHNAKGTDESDCLNSDHGGSQVETYLEDVVVPWVDAHYPVAPGYQYTAVGGMSEGGYCAVDQGLNHLDIYGTILGLMPYDSPGTSQLTHPTDLDKHLVLKYVPTMQFPHPVAVFLAYGSEDSETKGQAKLISAALEARGQQVTVVVNPGQGHTWNEAITAVAPGLEFWEAAMTTFEKTS